MRDGRNIHKNLVAKHKRKSPFKNPGMNASIILK
jgi:hypothetical protein